MHAVTCYITPDILKLNQQDAVLYNIRLLLSDSHSDILGNSIRCDFNVHETVHH